ncbi:hypothetical protein BB559_000979 [Furculomyces boomerangus]|uniref:Uncharacterized protein n=1 Tax=Furculomyces boomerangus TaxID=61424 RepID=A0A2T9Z3L0_9FUNG|nr:hypothetical protein BB559_000979 [Furculomyces boomerangus]
MAVLLPFEGTTRLKPSSSGSSTVSSLEIGNSNSRDNSDVRSEKNGDREYLVDGGKYNTKEYGHSETIASTNGFLSYDGKNDSFLRDIKRNETKDQGYLNLTNSCTYTLGTSELSENDNENESFFLLLFEIPIIADTKSTIASLISFEHKKSIERLLDYRIQEIKKYFTIKYKKSMIDTNVDHKNDGVYDSGFEHEIQNQLYNCEEFHKSDEMLVRFLRSLNMLNFQACKSLKLIVENYPEMKTPTDKIKTHIYTRAENWLENHTIMKFFVGKTWTAIIFVFEKSGLPSIFHYYRTYKQKTDTPNSQDIIQSELVVKESRNASNLKEEKFSDLFDFSTTRSKVLNINKQQNKLQITKNREKNKKLKPKNKVVNLVQSPQDLKFGMKNETYTLSIDPSSKKNNIGTVNTENKKEYKEKHESAAINSNKSGSKETDIKKLGLLGIMIVISLWITPQLLITLWTFSVFVISQIIKKSENVFDGYVQDFGNWTKTKEKDNKIVYTSIKKAGNKSSKNNLETDLGFKNTSENKHFESTKRSYKLDDGKEQSTKTNNGIIKKCIVVVFYFYEILLPYIAPNINKLEVWIFKEKTRYETLSQNITASVEDTRKKYLEYKHTLDTCTNPETNDNNIDKNPKNINHGHDDGKVLGVFLLFQFAELVTMLVKKMKLKCAIVLLYFAKYLTAAKYDSTNMFKIQSGEVNTYLN